MTEDGLLAEAARLAKAGDAAGAFSAYRECAKRHPACAAAWLGMSDLLAARGDAGAATQALSQGMAAGDAEARALIAPVFAERLTRLRIDGWHAPLDRDLRLLLNEPDVERQTLARMTARLLVAKPETQGTDADVLDRIAADPLWGAFLTECLNVDAAMEARLVDLRRALLEAGAASAGRRNLACRLALQAFAGEYVWPVSDEERMRVAALGERAGRDTDALVLWALYESPLVVTPSSDTAASLEALGEAGRLLALRALREVERETVLARGLPRLEASGTGEDGVSTAVRAQYEAHPYPRWRASPAPRPLALRDVLAALPGVGADRLPDAPLKVLIAGCGTGYEAIDLARMDPTLAINAIDLSRASLAYGARMAEDLGVETVEFRQGDILDLAATAPGFDVATSTGVLHHMDDPAAGLAAVAGVVRPGGLVRIALYSERARSAVVAAHDLIRAEGLEATPEGIRAFRARVLAAPEDSPLAALRTSDDFYSMSGCRDLVFQVHERRFSLPEAVALLEGAGLTWVGFDAPPEASAAFAQAYGEGAEPLDAEAWDRLEARMQTLFAGMYALWGRRPDK